MASFLPTFFSEYHSDFPTKIICYKTVRTLGYPSPCLIGKKSGPSYKSPAFQKTMYFYPPYPYSFPYPPLYPPYPQQLQYMMPPPPLYFEQPSEIIKKEEYISEEYQPEKIETPKEVSPKTSISSPKKQEDYAEYLLPKNKNIKKTVKKKEEDFDERALGYPKKNTQSNIVNQVFSYACHEERSHKTLYKIFNGDESKVKSFYQTTKFIKKQKKKYINRKFLVNLCVIEPNQSGYKMLERLVDKMKVLTVQDFQKALRLTIMYYLRFQSEISVVSSKKISTYTWYEHLQRRRQVKHFVLAEMGKMRDKDGKQQKQQN